MATSATVEAVRANPGRAESHVPRDELEMPPVGLCGFVAGDDRRVRKANQGERATCAVCRDLWEAGVRPRNYRACW